MYGHVNKAYPRGQGRAYPGRPTSRIGSWATEKLGIGAGTNLSALSHTLFRSQGAQVAWGSARNWAGDMVGIGHSGSPGIWRMMASRAAGQKYGVGAWIGRGFGPAFTTHAAIQGYKEGGLAGAMGAASEQVMYAAALGAAWGGVKNTMGLGGQTIAGLMEVGSLPAGTSTLHPAMNSEIMRRLSRSGPLFSNAGAMARASAIYGEAAPLGRGLAKQVLRSGKPVPFASGLSLATIGFAAAYGTYKGVQKWSEASIARSKRARKLEFGGPTLDVFGNMATMRMRSLQALQRSSLNGRYSMGNEAAALHQ